MNPRLRLWLVGSLAALLAVVVGFDLAQESYVFAAVILALMGWFALEWIGGPWPEAWLLAAAIVGYILGNRGFAQLALLPHQPLLPGEAILLIGTATTLLRLARKSSMAFQHDALNFTILLWCAVGLARLVPDVRNYGAVAIRDFATVYYAGFFFIAQSLAEHAASARLLRRTMLAASVVLPLSYFLSRTFPEFFFDALRIRGTPLVFYKDDLVAAYFFAGFFLIITMESWPWVWRTVVASAAYVSAFTIQSSRAAIVALCVTSGWWAVARRWAPWKLQALLAPCGVTLLLIAAVVGKADFKQSRAYALYEHVLSVTDFSGTGRYTTEDRNYLSDNNRFRVVWWRSITSEVLDENPIFGLGFGYNLTERFVRGYDFDLGEEFSTRSPHSILFTVLGRMGIVGLAAFLALVGAMAVRTWRLARRSRDSETALVALGWWSVAWVMFTSSTFGVVLEGPMGAIVFWTALGLANAMTGKVLAPSESTEADPTSSLATPRSMPASAEPVLTRTTP